MSIQLIDDDVIQIQLRQIISPGLSDHQRESLGRYLSRLSYNTVKTYLHWLNRWNAWHTEQHKRDPHWRFVLFPINPLHLAHFVNDLRPHLRHSSLELCVMALNSLSCRGLGHGSIITDDVKDVLVKADQLESLNKIDTGQAMPFHLKDLRKLISLHGGTRSLRMLRDLNMIWVGFETLLRSEEIRRIQMEDLTFDPKTRGFSLIVYRTKGKAKTTIYYEFSDLLSASIDRMMKMTGKNPLSHPTDYLFQAVDQFDKKYMPPGWGKRPQGKDKNALLKRHALQPAIDGSDISTLTTLVVRGNPAHQSYTHADMYQIEDPGMLSQSTILRAFESLWLSVYPKGKPDDKGKRYQCWTVHSVRVGGAQELLDNDYSLPQIMEMGNWSSVEMVMRYTRKMQSKNKAMTRLIKDGLRQKN